MYVEKIGISDKFLGLNSVILKFSCLYFSLKHYKNVNINFSHRYDMYETWRWNFKPFDVSVVQKGIHELNSQLRGDSGMHLPSIWQSSFLIEILFGLISLSWPIEMTTDLSNNFCMNFELNDKTSTFMVSAISVTFTERGSGVLGTSNFPKLGKKKRTKWKWETWGMIWWSI